MQNVGIGAIVKPSVVSFNDQLNRSLEILNIYQIQPLHYNHNDVARAEKQILVLRKLIAKFGRHRPIEAIQEDIDNCIKGINFHTPSRDWCRANGYGYAVEQSCIDFDTRKLAEYQNEMLLAMQDRQLQ